jgi:hypothetical protein
MPERDLPRRPRSPPRRPRRSHSPPRRRPPSSKRRESSPKGRTIVYVDSPFRTPPRLFTRLRALDPTVRRADFYIPGRGWDMDALRDAMLHTIH